MMVDKGDADILKGLLLPVGIGTAVIVGYAVLVRSFALGHRGYSQDGQYLVSVRFPGKWYALRDFVQPDNPDVIAVCSQIGPDTWQLFDFVCRHVSYKSEVGEHWQFPSETLARGRGDCEDTSLLLASLLRAGATPNCHVALGSYQGYGHAWCNSGGQILETTFTSARVVTNPADYCPYIYFNDTDVIELWPSALEEVFGLGRDEAAKLNRMEKVMQLCGR